MAVTNYLYQYSDGTTGNSPFQRDSSGNVITSPQGSVSEGKFLGRTMEDGSVNQSPLGNVTAQGNVNLYGGYSTPADQYFSNANEAIWGTPSGVGARPTAGYGYDGSTVGNTKPLAAGQSSGGGYGLSAPGGGTGGGGGGGGTSGTGYGAQNPYLLPMMQSITDQVTSNFNRNVMPQISQQMMATGGYGGSRQGVIEANAMRDMNQGLSNSLANLGLQDFNAQRGYDLGLRGNDLGYAGLDAQIAQNNFGNRLAGANFGLNLFNQGMANNQTGINAGTNIQNTPMNYWSQFANQYNGIGQGYGSTTGSTSQQGNPVLGALGGAQLGSRFAQGWGNTAGSASDTANGTNFWAPNFRGSMGD